ncbi:MAG: BatD family protein [bacterium]
MKLKKIEQPLSGQEDVEGNLYSVLEKKYILIPLESGLKKIDPIQVSFNVPAEQKVRSMRFGAFDIDSVFGRNVKTESTISNDLQINVTKLPVLNKSIDGVGLFSDFKMFVDKNEAILNEPILFTLEVSGIGNLDQVVAPKLNLPNNFTYYESKSKVEWENRISPLAGKKIFEYVVQVGDIGDYQVNEQNFVYFNTQEKIYESLQSNKIFLSIKKPPEQQLVNYLEQNKNKKIIDEDNKQNYGKDIHFIEENIQFLKEESKKELSFIWFFIALMFPLILLFKKLFLKLLKYLFMGFSANNLSSKFEKELDLIISEKNAVNLYRFFLNYFSFRFDLQENEVSESLIENKLLDLSWSHEKVGEFLSYLHLCASLSFASGAVSYLDINKLLEKSKYRFFMLESKK